METPYIPNRAVAIILAGIFRGIPVTTKRTVPSTLRRARVPEEAEDVIVRFAGYLIIIVAELALASQLGIEITSVIAGLGVAGLRRPPA